MSYCNYPLVSVPVVTYNSSKTVVETLDSICNQTYSNLELIVSDDCSTDNTVDICRKWIEAHKERFVRTELLTVEKNTGVSANSNRAKEKCRGEWVKGIAGDDILLPDCVETYIEYVKEHPDAVYVFAMAEVFGGEEEDRVWLQNFYYNELKSFFDLSIEEQYDYLTLKINCIPAPTSFYNKEKVDALGLVNDVRIPFLEDRPKWINLLKLGVRFHYIDKITVRYRLSDVSLCRKTPEKFEKSRAKLYVYYCFPNEFKKQNKRIALLKKKKKKKVIYDGALIWRVLIKMYKTVFRIN